MVRRKRDSSSSTQSGRGTPVKKQPHTEILVSRVRHIRTYERTMEEIKYFRESVDLLIPKAPFYRVVRDILVANLFNCKYVERIKPRALEALQESAEAYLVQFFEDCILVATHAKRVTIQKHDMRFQKSRYLDYNISSST